MDLNAMADAVGSRDHFVDFLIALRKDAVMHPEEWQNKTLDEYLEALSAWVRDMDGYYRNNNRPVPELPDWKNVAEMMLAAKSYE